MVNVVVIGLEGSRCEGLSEFERKGEKIQI